MIRYFLCYLLLHLTSVESARILGVFPMPSISHQVVFRALTLELAKRGHELVVMTPDLLPKNSVPDNYKEIDVSFGYTRLMEMIMGGKHLFKRGVIVSAEEHLKAEPNATLLPVIVEMIEHPELKKYTTDRNQHFDLIIAEAYMNYQLILSKIFNAPVILFTSFHGMPDTFAALGAPTGHPILYPTVMGEVYGGKSLIDRFKQLKFEYDFYSSMKKVECLENEILKKNYGPDAPTVEELKENIDMLFINSHPLFCGNRPLPPNAVYVGPLHMQPLKELPQDLKAYLDNSKTGVIYVSLGTNVRPSMMDKDLLDSFLGAFRELPYDILWKFDGDSLGNIPKNLKIQKWFPQRDLLVHPNIKLFVTQGGLQSTDESIDAGVPFVGIPMLGDQYYNVFKYEELGIGVKVDALTLDKDSLLKGIKTVLGDESYKNNIKKLKKIMNDEPQSPLERAVWWTEYVIRHGGAKHLRSPAATMTWAEYLMTDVVVPIISVILVAFTLIGFAIRSLLVTALQRAKVKQS